MAAIAPTTTTTTKKTAYCAALLVLSHFLAHNHDHSFAQAELVHVNRQSFLRSPSHPEESPTKDRHGTTGRHPEVIVSDEMFDDPAMAALEERDSDDNEDGSSSRNVLEAYVPDFTALLDTSDYAYDETNTTLREFEDNSFGIGTCQGPCNSDEQCKDGLLCYPRKGFSLVPGCEGEGLIDTGYCYDPASVVGGDTFDHVASKGTSELGKCQGECANSVHCRGSLLCMEREANETVPGCFGESKEGMNYCYDPFYGSDDPFQLRLYWQKGYNWQGDSREQKFCLECEEDKCQQGSYVEVRKCDASDTKFQFIRLDNGKILLKVSHRRLCVESVPFDSSLGDRLMALARCDETEERQQFVPGLGDFDGDRFELVASDNRCVTPEHHPRSKENVERFLCSTARSHKSSYWNKF